MAQPSVTSYFNLRKRHATDEIRNKAKVLVLEHEGARSISDSTEHSDHSKLTEVEHGAKIVYTGTDETKNISTPQKVKSAVHNIQTESTMRSSPRTPKTRARTLRAKRLVSNPENQEDIRASFLKMNENAKIVPFEKKGALSPKKNSTAKQNVTPTKIDSPVKNPEELPGAECTTPKKASLMDRMHKDLSYDDIKSRLIKSSRLNELRDRIDRLKRMEKKLEEAEAIEEIEPLGEPQPKIKRFEKIELEVPVSPQKSHRSPLKTPIKKEHLLSNASPQRRLLFEPKEKTPSPVKRSPTKVPAYQRYASLADTSTPGLPLPFNYRFLAEVFRCIDTVSALLFNRKETITFKKLKPAVEELLRRNFTVNHLAQIKTIYPDAFNFSQEKLRSFGSVSKQEKYELVLMPVVEEKSGRNTPDDNDVIKSASKMSMGPGVVLNRRRKFYSILLERTIAEHEKFLLSLEQPMVIPKEKITRWHPAFDLDNCSAIEEADLPKPPSPEKASSAQAVLEKAKSLFNCNTRMEKALQRLAEAKMTLKTDEQTITGDDKSNQAAVDEPVKIEIGMDTPPPTPTTQRPLTNPALKGIPLALLERVRAKQAAKALEAMTRTVNEDKEATIYARLPDMSKVVRNIFVAEKKGVLTLDFVIDKLDNSYRTKLMPHELEEHIKLMCKLLPSWASIQHVRKMDYLKIARDVDIAKIVKRLETLANDKVAKV